MKAEGHLDRCYLKGHAGDAAHAILAAVGYNFRRILAWLRSFAPNPGTPDRFVRNQPRTQSRFLTDD